MSNTKTEDVLHPNGIFNPFYRFAVTNITDEDFTSYWNGRPFTIKKGETVKLNHHLTVKVAKEMVDKIMQGEAKLDEVNFYKNNPNTAPNAYRSPKGLSLGIPAQRKIWEDKIVQQLQSVSDGIELEILRNETIEKLTEDLKKEPSTDPVPVPAAQLSHSNTAELPEVFAEIAKK